MATKQRISLWAALVLLLKDRKHLFERINHYGIGRLILERASFNPRLFSTTSKALRLAKILIDPIEFFQRRKLAKNIATNSNFKNLVPSDAGYAIFPPGTFDGVERILPIARSVYEKFLQNHVSGRNEQSNYNSLLSGSPQFGVNSERTDLRAHPEFQALAQYQPFIEIACDYLCEFPILAAIDLQVVFPHHFNENNFSEFERGPKEFHIDHGGGGGKCLKIFIAVEDLDEDNGSTMILNKASSRKLAREIGYKQGRISDEVVFRNPWKQQLVHISSPAGGVIFLDSYGAIHCGTRTKNRPRVVINLMYASKYIAGESELQRNRFDFDHSMAIAEPHGQFLFNL